MEQQYASRHSPHQGRTPSLSVARIKAIDDDRYHLRDVLAILPELLIVAGCLLGATIFLHAW
jgi:hypothetical protein